MEKEIEELIETVAKELKEEIKKDGVQTIAVSETIKALAELIKSFNSLTVH